MPRITQITLMLLLHALGSAATGLRAQDQTATPSAAEIGALLREEGHGGPALQVLRQRGAQQPRAILDAIGDSLTATAIAYGGRAGTENRRVATAAIDILALAGLEGEGVPYAGAGERLLRIAAELQHAGALWALSQLPNKPEAIRLVRGGVAATQQQIANVAVGLLARSMGSEGLAALHDLYREGSVVEPRAQEELTAVAQYHGWN